MHTNRLNYLEQLLLDDERLSYGVYWDNEPIWGINRQLMKRQGVTYETISLLHVERLAIEKDMQYLVDNRKLIDEIEYKLSSRLLRVLYKLWHNNQHKLQEEWNFGVNDDFIKFWEVPGCTCPRMDNNDRYPSGYYVTNLSCPVHGEL